MDLNLEKFDPTVAELTAMVAETTAVNITDFSDKSQVENVRRCRINLKNARVSVEKRGKELRADAITFQKAVIEKEHELVAIILPEEERLAKLEEEAKTYAVKQERLRKLPERKERFTSETGLGIGISDEAVILEMDDVQFETYLANAKAHVEAKRLAEQRAEQEAKEAELKRREQELKAKERAAKEAEEAKEREAKRLAELEEARLEGERQAKARLEAEQAAELARVEREKEEAAKAAAKLEKTKKYKAFLEAHGFTDATRGDFKIEETATGYVLYKRLGEFLK